MRHFRYKKSLFSYFLILSVLLFASGCEGTTPESSEESESHTAASSSTGTPTGTPTGATTETTAGTTTTATVKDVLSTDVSQSTPDGGDAVIRLDGTTATVDGSGVTVNGSTILITAGGTYTVSGTLTNGRILVDAEKQDVELILDGVSITCADSAPLYVFQSNITTIMLKEGTANVLADGTSYAYTDEYSSETEEEPNACLYSKADLMIRGGGTLTVNARFNNGITSKDTLTVRDTTITVTAANHGVNGKDWAILKNAHITVNSHGDALRSTNDSGEQDDSGNTLGYIRISDSTLDLTSVEDGIQAESTLTVENSHITVNTTGNANTNSAKGIKATKAVTLHSGSFDLTCTDDAVHSNGALDVKGGTFTVSSGDDAFHADTTLTIAGGDITVNKSYEGLEGDSVIVTGGTVQLTASDDGINAAGGVDNSGGWGNWGTSSGNSEIRISGGYVVVNASGDGVDANGTITQSGGTLIILGPTNSGNGALDYDSTFTVSGGILMAQGCSGMAQSPNALSQYGLSLTFDQTLSAGTYVQLKTDDQEIVLQTQKSTQNLIFSSAALAKGDTVTISCGGSYTGGTVRDGICSGGVYSGGTTLTTLTISEYLTTYGKVGIGGSMGGGAIGQPGRPGGFGGGGGRPGGWF